MIGSGCAACIACGFAADGAARFSRACADRPSKTRGWKEVEQTGSSRPFFFLLGCRAESGNFLGLGQHTRLALSLRSPIYLFRFGVPALVVPSPRVEGFGVSTPRRFVDPLPPVPRLPCPALLLSQVVAEQSTGSYEYLDCLQNRVAFPVELFDYAAASTDTSLSVEVGIGSLECDEWRGKPRR